MNKKQELTLIHDGALTIAVGKSRKETQWKNKEILWSGFIDRLSKPVRTHETMAEYHNLPKAQQADRKDIGGYVGGVLKGGRRIPENVVWRQVLTLDIDFPTGDVLAGLEILADWGFVLHSTHSSQPGRLRLRLIVPLLRPLAPDEYEPTCRRITADIGIDMFDNTTYELSRLMYWPSIPSDAEYVFHVQDAPWLDPDTVLARYPDWRDSSYWPESGKVQADRKRAAAKQGNPLEKRGLIGAFCRTYSVEAAIEKFLAGVYEPCGVGRYTYLGGSTAGGLVVYDDGKFVYSHHGTDLISGQLVNAFDLVRIHKFSIRDSEAAPETPVVKLPSYLAMQDFCMADGETKKTLGAERMAEALGDFEAIEEDDAWLKQLAYNRKGELEASLTNLVLIMKHDPRLQAISYDNFKGCIVLKGKTPWRLPDDNNGPGWLDLDDTNLRAYIEEVYKIYSPQKVLDALVVAAGQRGFHPIEELLEAAGVWDGIERVDTLLVKYGGAEDTPYVRAVTRKTLVAAIKRIKRPGCKFDSMLVLNGLQGIGKSTLFARLGGKYFSDSLSMTDARDKTAAEKLQGYWILEISELAGLKKAELEAVKGFLSRQYDVYRPSYGRRTVEHPRQCIIVGSTNNDLGFLRDPTGNRRFWPVNVYDVGDDKAAWNMTDYEVCQVWAEATRHYEAGEKLYLTGEEAAEALMQQGLAMETDERLGLIQEYLERLLPESWPDMGINDRRAWLHQGDFGENEGTVRRDVVSVAEIWTELLCRDLSTSKRYETDEIHALMKRIPGWEKYPGSKEGKVKFRLYGVQRAYSRIR